LPDPQAGSGSETDSRPADNSTPGVGAVIPGALAGIINAAEVSGEI
jgi:hypothetical protein